jgi:hypothetical protein
MPASGNTRTYAARPEAWHSIPPLPGFAGNHRPRPARLTGRLEFGGWRLKLYSITLPGREPRAALLDSVASLARQVLPPAGGPVPGLGFAIAHDAATVCFSIIYWWQNDNELHQRMFWSPREQPEAAVKVENPACGCVFELGIVDFERRAWLADMLANPTGPDPDRYWSRALEGDVG